MSIYWLGTPLAHNARLVGGKAAQLSRLAADYPVPPGFCLPALPSTARLDANQRQEIVSAYARLGEPAVAVRSSAIDEDGFQASFAGQHDTFLNVCGAPAVIACVQQCLESAASDRALAYRSTMAHHFEKPNRLALPDRPAYGVGRNQPAIAILIQKLIRADVSAVVFSADPASGRRDRIVINATWGLGESLVSGLVTPDLFILARPGLSEKQALANKQDLPDQPELPLVQSQIACKTVMTVNGPEGTRQVPIPRALQTEPSLQPGQVRLIARLVLDLEQRQGWPVDVECAFQGTRLFLLQCRPITTLLDGQTIHPVQSTVRPPVRLPV